MKSLFHFLACIFGTAFEVAILLGPNTAARPYNVPGGSTTVVPSGVGHGFHARLTRSAEKQRVINFTAV